jgi:hypothetical protein
MMGAGYCGMCVIEGDVERGEGIICGREQEGQEFT